MDITPIQRGIMLLVFTGLIGWLIYYWWMLAGGRHPSKRQPTSYNLDNQSNSRLNQALLSLQEFQQQPILESARLNFLRQLGCNGFTRPNSAGPLGGKLRRSHG